MMVSIIIITKNRLNFLKECVSSVLFQTYTDYELIIVDNDSNDGTDIFCNTLLNDKVKYIHNDTCGNPNYSRNLGAKLARGEYIAFLDDDDYWEHTKLAKQVHLMEDSHKDVAMIFVNSINLYDYGNIKIFSNNLPNKKNCNIYIDNFLGNTSNPLIRKGIFFEIGMFDENLDACQEYDLWIRILEKYSYKIINENLLYYRIQSEYKNQITGSAKKYTNSIAIINQKYKSEISQLSKANKVKRNRRIQKNTFNRSIKSDDFITRFKALIVYIKSCPYFFDVLKSLFRVFMYKFYNKYFFYKLFFKSARLK